ncbi:MAG: NAD(+) synthase [Gemmataceae bacterium]
MLQGFLRVAAAVPQVRVGDPGFHLDQHRQLLRQAAQAGVHLVVFPELSLTGYTCGDLFGQATLQRSALRALLQLLDDCPFAGLAVVGLPLVVDDQLFNVAAVIQGGRLLGLVPKSYLPTYKEFYESRWFAPAALARSREVTLPGQPAVGFGTDLVFRDERIAELAVGVEICEDLWMPIAPSSRLALAGATVLVNLSASNEIIGKAAYRRQLVVNQSAKCIAAYIYASCGVSESTTDLVFGGHCLIAENGTLLAETPRYQREAQLLVADVDLDRLRGDRLRTSSFAASQLYESASGLRGVSFALDPMPQPLPLRRWIDPRPFVPSQEDQLHERCEEIFQIQIAGLAKRLEHLGKPPVVLGISGGLDSTLALLVTVKTFDLLGLPRERITGFTMPGFGTTSGTRTNALALMDQLGIRQREIDIRPLCLAEMRALGHAPFGIALEDQTVEELDAQLRQLPPERRTDLVFENIQARMRTSLLMNSGFVIGTGDVSELALGWCTYNADHLSMYNPNVSVPKTLVQFLVQWAAQNEFDGPARQTLLSIAQTVISPELLPPDASGQIVQSTEDTIGPYELHDFFLYHTVRFGTPPRKLLFLAQQAQFSRDYSKEMLTHWLNMFIRRFFSQQFKRSCLPDGPKVGSISLSPRGDWRMPSDASSAAWQADLELEFPA